VPYYLAFSHQDGSRQELWMVHIHMDAVLDLAGQEGVRVMLKMKTLFWN
jgi:hypothetical protein